MSYYFYQPPVLQQQAETDQARKNTQTARNNAPLVPPGPIMQAVYENQVLAQGQGLQIGKAAKALEDAGKELEPSKVRTFFASFNLADASAGTVGSKENIEKLTQGLGSLLKKSPSPTRQEETS